MRSGKRSLHAIIYRSFSRTLFTSFKDLLQVPPSSPILLWFKPRSMFQGDPPRGHYQIND